MEFKYQMNGEDGELFEEGVVLARQYLGIGDWHVWDLRPKVADTANSALPALNGLSATSVAVGAPEPPAVTAGLRLLVTRLRDELPD